MIFRRSVGQRQNHGRKSSPADSSTSPAVPQPWQETAAAAEPRLQTQPGNASRTLCPDAAGIGKVIPAQTGPIWSAA